MNITSIEFRNYKALRHYSLAVQAMNVLVGPNNCGKSTLIDAFKLLSVALRRARSKKPNILSSPKGYAEGYEISSDMVAVSLENSHTDYSDDEATITFRLSNNNRLQLFFPKEGGCRLLALTNGKPISSVAAFKEAFPITLAIVPVLGRVDHDEPLLQQETVQRNIETHLASRHFRNYWYYYPEDFSEFAESVAKTWPGMKIQKPELIDSKPMRLAMFCLEDRITREIFWAGSGFQIWCQLLTHIVAGRGKSVIVVDEPEIYLHPDVQRQLVGILRQSGSDVVIATHSPEIIGEADPAEIVLVDKRKLAGQRLKDASGIQAALDELGSSQNVTLTRLARNRRVLFVEDDYDFGIIRRFARRLGFLELASGTDITAVPSNGFSSWKRVEALGWGLPRALGQDLLIGAIYDRDYSSDEHIEVILKKLRDSIASSHVHVRKEIDNYLIVPSVLTRAVKAAIEERTIRGEGHNVPPPTSQEVDTILLELTEPFRSQVQSQAIARRQDHLKGLGSKLDAATIAKQTLEMVESKWGDIRKRVEIVPGKNVLASVRQRFQSRFSVNLTDHRIVSSFHLNEIPPDLKELIEGIEVFRKMRPRQARVEPSPREGDDGTE